ncbi:MAG: ABC transporter substrate-binding protein, partial [Candidatus Gastranaerophilales bacterium]|nr:ABC transporter substrate-binding protein [Candidatus Gastranaerophilales bacterium]
YINNIIYQFEKENPDIKIKWVDVPYSEGEKRILAAVLTDNPPDLVNLTPDFSLLLAQKNVLEEIDISNLKQYLPSLLETLKYDNKFFGIPFYATSAITLYNSDKLNIKNPPKTYDELFKIHPEKGTCITMLNFSENDTILKILNKYNINTPSSLRSEKSQAIYQEFKRLYDNNLIPKESITQTHRDALEKYMSGELIFLVTGGNFLNMIKENAPSVYNKTVVLPQLTGDTGLYDYSLMNFIIPKRAKHKENALKFALFLTNKENQLEFAKLTPVLPVNKEALNDEYFQKASDDIQEKARVTAAKQLNKIQPPLKNIKNKKELNTLSSNYIQSILIENAPIKESLEEFAKDWEKL